MNGNQSSSQAEPRCGPNSSSGPKRTDEIGRSRARLGPPETAARMNEDAGEADEKPTGGQAGANGNATSQAHLILSRSHGNRGRAAADQSMHEVQRRGRGRISEYRNRARSRSHHRNRICSALVSLNSSKQTSQPWPDSSLSRRWSALAPRSPVSASPLPAPLPSPPRFVPSLPSSRLRDAALLVVPSAAMAEPAGLGSVSRADEPHFELGLSKLWFRVYFSLKFR